MTDHSDELELDIDLIFEYYAMLDRQGPGSDEITVKALSFIEGLNKDSMIADIGCGTGGQTFTLLEQTRATVIAVDFSQLFITMLNEKVREKNLANRLIGRVASMDQLPFENEQYDLIWSEGAIYNIGFELGLNLWKSFIKKGGYIAVTEISWLTSERPDEINDYWNRVYPEINTIDKKVAQMNKAGYVTIATFVLPETCWLDKYYHPQESIQKLFLIKHHDNPAVENFIAEAKYEQALYEKYRDYYGYVFYIGKKIN